uniref:Uncharacterized protein n=1 Tax=Arundo donax TaxID=35708 RepID=A0A0A9GGR4_ARUDO
MSYCSHTRYFMRSQVLKYNPLQLESLWNAGNNLSSCLNFFPCVPYKPLQKFVHL